MTTFLDGPAAGVTLCLKTAPLYLRVVQNGPTFDALDMPSDEPDPMELVYAYVRVGKPGFYMASHRGGKSSTGITATYRLLDRQPTEIEANDNALWQAWAVRVQAIRKQEHEQRKLQQQQAAP